MIADAHIANMGATDAGTKLTATISFRLPEKMVAGIEAHRAKRRLEKQADAARELMAAGLAAANDTTEIYDAAVELRRLGGDPVKALHDALAEFEAPLSVPEIKAP